MNRTEIPEPDLAQLCATLVEEPLFHASMGWGRRSCSTRTCSPGWSVDSPGLPGRCSNPGSPPPTGSPMATFGRSSDTWTWSSSSMDTRRWSSRTRRSRCPTSSSSRGTPRRSSRGFRAMQRWSCSASSTRVGRTGRSRLPAGPGGGCRISSSVNGLPPPPDFTRYDPPTSSTGTGYYRR